MAENKKADQELQFNLIMLGEVISVKMLSVLPPGNVIFFFNFFFNFQFFFIFIFLSFLAQAIFCLILMKDPLLVHTTCTLKERKIAPICIYNIFE